jgi:ABC-type lipoprotein release transport system permease subunit
MAIPLSLPMSWILGWRFGRIMIPVPATYLPEMGAVLWWLLLVLLVSVLATLWPALRATRIPTAAALAYE